MISASLAQGHATVVGQIAADYGFVHRENCLLVPQADPGALAHLRETELRLQKEIEVVRREIEQIRAELKADIEQVRAELKADIEQVRADLRQTELRLQKEIEGVRREIAQVKVDLLKWLVPLMFAQVAAIAALVKLL